MDNQKKINRWLSQTLHCYEQTNAIITQAQQATSAAFLAHCHERLEFFSARTKVLARRMRRLEADAKKGLAEARSKLAEASKKHLDTIYDAVRQRGQVILTKKDDGGVRFEIPPAEKT